MNEKTLITLEYNKIIDRLTAKAISVMGKELARTLKPCSDLDEINAMQQETTEAAGFIVKKGPLPLGGLKDLRPSLQRVGVGGALSIEELLQVGDFCYVCRKVLTYAKQEGKNDHFPLLEPLFGAVAPMSGLEKEICRCIVNQQEVADDASPKLYELRRGIKIAGDRIKEQLNSIIHSQAYKNMIQDSVITIRSGRYCVPIKQEYRSAFPGMVHDQSATGATVFIEPLAVVQFNNKIRELRAEEKNEVDKILRELSYMVAEQAEQIAANLSVLTRLDFIFAKGELSLVMKASRPVFNQKGYVHIKKGRHPLLDQGSVVPIDIYMGQDFHILLITGPNTGGKTVALKTLGLFALMGQAGLHIPAFDNSELAVFDRVFADIGDEQSIEQSLSTFSAHMSNIVKILEEIQGVVAFYGDTSFVSIPSGNTSFASIPSGNTSLVLLDELGAGTDPTEGAALAMSILQFLHRNGIRTAVTTHYSELKVYALSTEAVENASCEFDVETLRPTYRLLIGVPGKSNAFAISQKLGLSENIIQEAKEFLSHEDKRFEDIITDLEISKKTVAMEQERAAVFRREAENLKDEFEKQKQKLTAQRDKILLTAKEEARFVVMQAKEEADSLLKELHKQMKESTGQKSMEATRRELGNKLSKLDDEINTKRTDRQNFRPVPKSLKKGDGVWIRSMNTAGIVTTPPDSAGQVMIQAGIMKIKVSLSDLSLNDKEETVSVQARPYSAAVKAGKSQSVSPEIDLRGLMVTEALEKTDKYLDDAYLSGLRQVVLIHGKGTGALRKAIQDHLKGHAHVKSYRPGAFGEGEQGVTVVELRE